MIDLYIVGVLCFYRVLICFIADYLHKNTQLIHNVKNNMHNL